MGMFPMESIRMVQEKASDWRRLACACLALAAMGAALWAARSWFATRRWTGVWANVTQLGALVALGTVVYFGTHFLFARRTFAARLRALRKRR